MSSDATTGGNIAVSIVSVITGGIVVIVVAVLIYKCCKLRMWRKYGGLSPDPPVLAQLPSNDDHAHVHVDTKTSTAAATSRSAMAMIDVVKNRPVRFSSPQLQEFTGNYAERLGAGGFGVVYKGQLPNRGMPVAVKVLNSSMGRRAEEQFMAEIGTIGRTSHVNLVRLYGFCFDADLKALVYECMPNGSLERYLFLDDDDHGDGDQSHKQQQQQQLTMIGFDKLYDIAIGTAKALRYLHDECARRIIHYDIKPSNVLLDEGFEPKVADFGLAKLCDREKTHQTMTGGARGTPGYAAPELWMQAPATHKCDVYSYGMLLFEILGRRRNYMQEAGMESHEYWFPRWVWQRMERGEAEAVVARAQVGADESRRKKAERMCAVALWCVQYRQEERPSMSNVVRMLEGDEDIAPPAVSPFAHLELEVDPLVTTVTDTTTLDSATSSS